MGNSTEHPPSHASLLRCSWAAAAKKIKSAHRLQAPSLPASHHDAIVRPEAGLIKGEKRVSHDCLAEDVVCAGALALESQPESARWMKRLRMMKPRGIFGSAEARGSRDPDHGCCAMMHVLPPHRETGIIA